MAIPKVLVLSGYGLNCEEETLHAFRLAGADGRIVHVNDIIDNRAILKEYQILAIPGGFSYGDDTGSGNALANRINNNMQAELLDFFRRGTLSIGICNGCQVMVNLGVVPARGLEYGKRQAALLHNKSNIYQCRWVHVRAEVNNKSPWLAGIGDVYIPVAHGEGNFLIDNNSDIAPESPYIALRYIKPDGMSASGEFPYNPNGSMGDIAGLSDESGRILALMPHPERAVYAWQAGKGAENADQKWDGITFFENAVKYFTSA